MTFSEKALRYINERNQKFIESGLEKHAIVLFYYSSESWLLSFCGNFVELVESKKVENDKDFILWTDFSNKNLDIDVYIEKSIIEELESKPLIEIHAAIGEVKGETIGVLFIKN